MSGLRIVSIDPGDKHVGIALGGATGCYDCWETNPADALRWLRGALEQDSVDVVLYEGFRLYAAQAAKLINSEMETCQMIGAIKACWGWFARPHVTLATQPASIQKPTIAILRAKKVVSTAKSRKAGPHALSAELHLRYYQAHLGSMAPASR